MDFTDMVFIDPVAPGFAVPGDKDESKKKFYSIKPDIEYLSRTVYDWLLKNRRDGLAQVHSPARATAAIACPHHYFLADPAGRRDQRHGDGLALPRAGPWTRAPTSRHDWVTTLPSWPPPTTSGRQGALRPPDEGRGGLARGEFVSD